MLEHIIGRPASETLNGGLLSNRARDQQKRRFGAFGACHPQRFEAVVGGKQIVCQDEIELLRSQSGFKSRTVVSQDDFDLIALFGQ